MIINQNDKVVVPNNTIAFFPVIPDDVTKPFNLNDVKLFLKPLNTSHKRDWFSSHFYKCLPLSIGNMQGFVFSLPYTVTLFWNGGNNIEDLQISYKEDFQEYKDINFIYPSSEFGHGIVTIHFPLTLKTPPGINLMTIAPPNFPLTGLSPMTGVVESDNIRFSFTLNIKVDLPNVNILIEKDTPLVGLLPIPRYFCDSFELKNAYDIFDKNIVEEEIKTVEKNGLKRIIANKNNAPVDGLYYSGKDINGNKFKDHQLPKKNKLDF
jgi:hypothetical protein